MIVIQSKTATMEVGMESTRHIYITFGTGTPLRNRYVRITMVTDRPAWEVAHSLFGARYATTYDESAWQAIPARIRDTWTKFELTGAVLTALRGGELPLADEYGDDAQTARAHMTQDLATL